MIRKDVKIYCCEDISKIENYKQALNAKTTWDVHHKREITENKTSQQLIDESLYFNRPANELIFLSRKEHIRIHREHNLHALDNWIKAGSDATRNVSKTEDHKQKLSESLKEYFKTHEHWNKGELYQTKQDEKYLILSIKNTQTTKLYSQMMQENDVQMQAKRPQR